MKTKLNNSAFTLIELLAVVIVMMIILGIAIPAVSKIAVKSKEKAFFVSVSNMVDSVGSQSIFDDKNRCIYYYEYDKDELPSNIASLYIVVRPEEGTGRAIYGVYAEQFDDKRAIDISDFSEINQSNSSSWIKDIDSEESATWVVSSLITNFISTNNDNPDIIDYKLCSKVTE